MVPPENWMGKHMAACKTNDLLAGDFGRELLLIAKKCTMPVSFSAPGRDDWLPLKSGSAFALRTPKKLMLVTAKHVYDDYIKFRLEYKKARFQVGNIEFSPEIRLLGLGDKADIATFDLSQQELISLEKVPLTFWPPVLPQEDAPVLFAGFPGRERSALGPSTFKTGVVLATGRTMSVTNEQIKTRIEHDDLIDPFALGRTPEPGYDIGGMSGGPMISLLWRGPLLYWALGGVISEGWAALDLIVAHSADGITETGTIRF